MSECIWIQFHYRSKIIALNCITHRRGGGGNHEEVISILLEAFIFRINCYSFIVPFYCR